MLDTQCVTCGLQQSDYCYCFNPTNLVYAAILPTWPHENGCHRHDNVEDFKSLPVLLGYYKPSRQQHQEDENEHSRPDYQAELILRTPLSEIRFGDKEERNKMKSVKQKTSKKKVTKSQSLTEEQQMKKKLKKKKNQSTHQQNSKEPKKLGGAISNVVDDVEELEFLENVTRVFSSHPEFERYRGEGDDDGDDVIYNPFPHQHSKRLNNMRKVIPVSTDKGMPSTSSRPIPITENDGEKQIQREETSANTAFSTHNLTYSFPNRESVIHARSKEKEPCSNNSCLKSNVHSIDQYGPCSDVQPTLPKVSYPHQQQHNRHQVSEPFSEQFSNGFNSGDYDEDAVTNLISVLFDDQERLLNELRERQRSINGKASPTEADRKKLKTLYKAFLSHAEANRTLIGQVVQKLGGVATRLHEEYIAAQSSHKEPLHEYEGSKKENAAIEVSYMNEDTAETQGQQHYSKHSNLPGNIETALRSPIEIRNVVPPPVLTRQRSSPLSNISVGDPMLLLRTSIDTQRISKALFIRENETSEELIQSVAQCHISNVGRPDIGIQNGLNLTTSHGAPSAFPEPVQELSFHKIERGAIRGAHSPSEIKQTDPEKMRRPTAPTARNSMKKVSDLAEAFRKASETTLSSSTSLSMKPSQRVVAVKKSISGSSTFVTHDREQENLSAKLQEKKAMNADESDLQQASLRSKHQFSALSKRNKNGEEVTSSKQKKPPTSHKASKQDDDIFGNEKRRREEKGTEKKRGKESRPDAKKAELKPRDESRSRRVTSVPRLPLSDKGTENSSLFDNHGRKPSTISNERAQDIIASVNSRYLAAMGRANSSTIIPRPETRQRKNLKNPEIYSYDYCFCCTR